MIFTNALFTGNCSLLVHCAQAYLDAGHAVCAVVSARQDTVQWAESRGIPVFADEASALQAPHSRFDYLFSIADPGPKPCQLISRAQCMALCFNDSLLPAYAGWNAPTWALIAQEKMHGVSWQAMTALGEGPIVRQAFFDIPAGETALGLHARCYEAGLASFNALVDEIGQGPLVSSGAGTADGDARQASHFSRQDRPPLLATLDFSRPANELAALVNALDFGLYRNPVARPKIYLGQRVLLVRSASVLKNLSGDAPGTVQRIEGDTLQVTTCEGDIVLSGCSDASGGMPDTGLSVGSVLPVLGGTLRQRLADCAAEVGNGESFWLQAFTTLAPVELPYPQKPSVLQPGNRQLCRLRLPMPAPGTSTVAAFFAWLSALTAQTRISLMYSDKALTEKAQGLESWLSPWVPLTLDIPAHASALHAAERADAGVAQIHRAGACPLDLATRLGAKPGTHARCSRIGISLNGGTALPAEVDVAVMAGPAGEPLELVADIAVFSKQTLTAMASHLACYLMAFQKAPALSGISLLPESETALVAALNATAVACDTTPGIHALIAAQTAQTPERTAVSFRGQSLSYRELDIRATALAQRLQQRGVGPGSIIGVSLQRGPELIVSLLAILKAGAGYLPLDPDYPHERLLYMIEDSQAPLVITSRAVMATLAIPAEKVFLLDDPATHCVQAPALADHGLKATAQRLAYLIYTSGSTGRPKGVVITHQNVLNLFTGLDACIPHAPPGRWLAETSFSFDMSVPELWWTLARGFTMVLHSNAAPHVSIADAVLQEDITHLQCTPSMASMLVAETAGRHALSRLSVLMIGGEAVSLTLAKELQALVPGAVFNLYGPTETTVWSTACRLDEMGDFVPLGRPIANTCLSIRTPAGAECPALVAGELFIGGAGVSAGYWQRPELTAERFVTDAASPGTRLYRTGDLVRRHPDGAFEFLGRIDHQVKIRGHRIELGEIEAVLLRQEGVKEAVVVAREEAAGDWSLAAYVTPQAGTLLDTAQIRRGLAEKLPAIMLPRTLMVLRTLPLTPNGKVDRRALPVKAAATGAARTLPASPLEKAIAAIWEQVLGQPGMAASDNFFSAGGTFFLAVQVQRRLRAACGCEMSLADLIRFPTLRLLATHLEGSAALGMAAPTQTLADAAPGAWLPAVDTLFGSEAAETMNLVESVIAQWWRDLLGAETISLQDDFFALGGHSLTAVRLFTQIRKQFAVDLPLATLLQASSLAGLAAIVTEHCEMSLARTEAAPAALAPATHPPGERPWSALVPICLGVPGQPPLFCVHGAGGNVLNFKPLSLGLGPDQPCYGLQAQGVDGHLPPLETIEAMAAQYVEAIRSVQPQGPYQLIGYCAGGVIAFEMAQQLRRVGQSVSLLAMINALSPTAAERKPSFFRRLWLMRHWSLKFILGRSRRRREGDLLDARYALAVEQSASDNTLLLEHVEFTLYRNYAAAQKRYQCEAYPGPLLIFRATKEVDMASLHAGRKLGWNEHVQGRIRVADIDAVHLFLLNEPALSQLIETLKQELASFETAAVVPEKAAKWLPNKVFAA